MIVNSVHIWSVDLVHVEEDARGSSLFKLVQITQPPWRYFYACGAPKAGYEVQIAKFMSRRASFGREPLVAPFICGFQWHLSGDWTHLRTQESLPKLPTPQHELILVQGPRLATWSSITEHHTGDLVQSAMRRCPSLSKQTPVKGSWITKHRIVPAQHVLDDLVPLCNSLQLALTAGADKPHEGRSTSAVMIPTKEKWCARTGMTTDPLELRICFW